MAAKYNSPTKRTNKLESIERGHFFHGFKSVLFLVFAIPNGSAQRKALKITMEHSGAWMGFHLPGSP